MEKRKLYFNEELHRYTDELNNVYTSTTTIIHKYYDEFKSKEVAAACERIGRNPSHPKYLKYKGKTVKQLLHEWEITKNTACDKGTNKHNFLETCIRASTNYKLIKGNYINDRIYTIDDILSDESVGRLKLDYFEEAGIKDRYPIIYNIIADLVKLGWKIYAEIGVYDSDNIISGLIDVLLVRDNEFIILDWKTNAQPIRFETGYFEKDNDGRTTDNFISKMDWFYAPIGHVPASVGHKYSLQLSGYANMVELFGLKHKCSILCQIREVTDKWDQVTEEVNILNVVDLKYEFKLIKEHHYNQNHRLETGIKTLF